MCSKKAIILLHATHESNIERLQESLNSCCKNNNFTIIKTIIAYDQYECQVLSGLINLIRDQNGSINLIVTNNSLNELFHIFTYTVIATLLEAKLINSLYIYQDRTSRTTNTNKAANSRPYYAINKERLLENKRSLLPFCAEYYKAMIMLKKIETLYDNE